MTITYNLEGKDIRIPKKDIERLVKTMDIDEEEAIEIWLEDEGYLVNEEQEELCQKSKENKVVHQAKSTIDPNQKKKREVIKKENPTKQMIIAEISKLLPDFAENVVIENDTKIITFSIGDNEYKIDLIQKRKTKN